MITFYNEIPLTRYERAEALFESAALKHDICDETLIPEIKEHLENCVDMLRNLYNEGLVETVEGLPNSSDIRCFEFFGLGCLITDLRERYFPTEEIFDAA